MVTTNKPANANDMCFTALPPSGSVAQCHQAYDATPVYDVKMRNLRFRPPKSVRSLAEQVLPHEDAMTELALSPLGQNAKTSV
jgi:hypothetical protein